MKKFHVIGITGTNGSGKGSAVEELVDHYGAKHISMSGLIIEEGSKIGIDTSNRDKLREFGNSLRNERGFDYLSCLAAEKIKQHNKGLFVVESLRCAGEPKCFSEIFGRMFILVGVDAPVEIRYDRIRSIRNGEKDKVSFEEFKFQEQLESESTDRWKQNLLLCADMVPPRFLIWNEWDLKYLRKRVREIASEIGLEPIRKRRS